MQRENNQLTLGSYSIRLCNATGKYVSRSVICKWFLTKHAFKGALRILDQVPIDKYSPFFFIVFNSLSAKTVLAGEKLEATYSIST
jgi:hypothetical protein